MLACSVVLNGSSIAPDKCKDLPRRSNEMNTKTTVTQVHNGMKPEQPTIVAFLRLNEETSGGCAVAGPRNRKVLPMLSTCIISYVDSIRPIFASGGSHVV